MQAILSPEKSLGTETTSVNALIQTLSSVGTSESSVSNSGIVYPWPQYFVNTVDDEGNEQLEDRYPGEYSEAAKLRAFSPIIWPEVRFVEEYMKGSTQKESGNIDVDFENSLKDNPFMGINRY